MVTQCSRFLIIFHFCYITLCFSHKLLSSSEFRDFIYGKEKAFFVQFYSSRDQNSIAFSPIWKKLADNVAEWASVVELAAVDCELDTNADLCKQHNLNTYPTLKYFKYKSVNAEDGQLYEGKKTTVDDLRTAITQFALADFEKNKPAGWPDFTVAHDSKPSENLWHDDTHFLAFVFETYSKSGTTHNLSPLIGAQTILDFSSDPNVLVRRGTSRHQLSRANGIKEFPGLLMFSRSHAGAPVYVSKDDMTRDEIYSRMHRYMDVDSKEHEHERAARKEDL